MRLHLLSAILFATVTAAAQHSTPHGRVDSLTVHCDCLAHNLNGDSADRAVKVYLPPGYFASLHKRFPVVYLLHGYKGSGSQWTSNKDWNLAQEMDRDVASGTVADLILVMPDADTRAGGSFYTNSVADGNWEDFIAVRLVSEIDQRYRTLRAAASRGIAGHSMGGYGALRLAFDHPEVFSSVYALSPCCLAWTGDFSLTNPAWSAALGITSLGAFHQPGDYFAKAFAAMAIAWSPNPGAPPFHADLPVRRTPAGIGESSATRIRWDANLIVAIARQRAPNLSSLHAIAFDAGRNDPFTHIPIGEADLDRFLIAQHIAHTFELYDGDHTSGIAARVSGKMLPFFSRNLRSN